MENSFFEDPHFAIVAQSIFFPWKTTRIYPQESIASLDSAAFKKAHPVQGGRFFYLSENQIMESLRENNIPELLSVISLKSKPRNIFSTSYIVRSGCIKKRIRIFLFPAQKKVIVLKRWPRENYWRIFMFHESSFLISYNSKTVFINRI